MGEGHGPSTRLRRVWRRLRLRLMRVLELFSGLGGWRIALGEAGRVVAAYDVSEPANDTYALNHGEQPIPKELATVSLTELTRHEAQAWLLSPPCQPFCRMGKHQGLADRRSRAFLHLMDIFQEAPPDHLVIENVPGFLGSDAEVLLSKHVQLHGMYHLNLEACPSHFGIPNQRSRAYVVVSRKPLKPFPIPNLQPRPLADFLDEAPNEDLYLGPETLARHQHGMDFVVPGDDRSTCFIGGYGRRFVGSGSFLKTPRGVRRFSPREIARILGLPEDFHFPREIPLEVQYRLLGNSLSIPVASWALDHLLNR